MLGIGRHDLEVTGRPKGEQGISRTPPGMNTPEGSFHSGKLIEKINPRVEIAGAQDNVIENGSHNGLPRSGRSGCGEPYAANLYPCPCTVRMNFGCLGLYSSFCRNQATCTSTVRVEGAEL